MEGEGKVTDVDSLLKTTLEGLGAPVERLVFTGNAPVFFTYQFVLGADTAFADDESSAEEFLYRIDLYTKGDFFALLRRTKQALKAVGFYGITVDPEVYEQDTGYYHVPIEMKYMEV